MSEVENHTRKKFSKFIPNRKKTKLQSNINVKFYLKIWKAFTKEFYIKTGLLSESFHQLSKFKLKILLKEYYLFILKRFYVT